MRLFQGSFYFILLYCIQITLSWENNGSDSDATQRGKQCNKNSSPSKDLESCEADYEAVSLVRSADNVTTGSDSSCPSLANANTLTPTELLKRLTLPCRYDRYARPQATVNGTITVGPVNVYARVYVYVLDDLETSDLQFKMHGLLQLQYVDPRLNFSTYAIERTQPIKGGPELRESIWMPHLFLANEQQSSILGTNEKDIRISVTPEGQVTLSCRLQAALYCWVDLKKFPFDEQFCSTIIESWMYNSSEVELNWQEIDPVTLNPKLHLTEFTLQGVWSNESTANADFSGLQYGAFAGNYSSLSFTVHLVREAGYYVMDYFLPSMMIVAISWVSFWLQADQTPARTTLGTTTLLSFITLASSQENNLPKVSYIKISEVWFLGCTIFIFGSLVEFAFVNTIWRRKRNLELKKVSSKHILKSTLTPNMKRRKEEMCPGGQQFSVAHSNNNNNLLSIEDGSVHRMNSATSVSIKLDDCGSLCTMTPHEASCWIDRKARFVFPLAFLIFNAFFWTFVYCF